MTKFPSSFLILLLLSFLCQVTFLGKTYALTQDELALYREEAKESASKMKPDVDSYFSDQKKAEEIKKASGHETDSPPGTDMNIRDAESKGARAQEEGAGIKNYQYQCTKKNCQVGETLSSQSILTRQEKIDDTMVIRDKDGKIIGQKAFVDNILANQRNANEAFSDVNGSQAPCTPSTETFTKTTPDTCDSYFDYTTNSCYPSQVVEIDPKFNYSCNKKREIKEKICSDEIISISCKDNKECDYGGIVKDSVASDMALKIDPGVITLGSIRDNEWGGRCDIIDRTTTFKAKNIKQIKEFRIFEVGFDDYLLIKVNENVVYVGPDGGSKLEVVIGKGWYKQPEKQVYNGINNQACERDTNWRRNVDIDIKPYLKEGINTIDIRVIVYGWGEGWLKIKAKAQCCSEWNPPIREEKCEYR